MRTSTAIVRNKKEIVDIAALRAAIDAVCDDRGKPPRMDLVRLLKDAYDAGWQEIKRRHSNDRRSGRKTAAALSYLTDQIIMVLFDIAITRVFPLSNPTEAETMTLIATGGYGRGELAPFSDIDLLFLLPYKRTGWAENITEFMLYTLWDMKLTVGQAVRTPADCVRHARDDATIATNLLEGRYLAGDKALYTNLSRAFHSHVIGGRETDFIEKKLAERDNRHDRMGDSRYVVEPNLKEGKGGLRDLHTLFWIGAFLFGVDRPRGLVEEGYLTDDEYKTFRKAEDFLWTVRVSLHYLAGRAEERLTFDVQLELAGLLRYTDRPGQRGVERFMKHYFLVAKQVGDLTRTICAQLEMRQQKRTFGLPRLRRRSISGIKIDGDRLTLRSEAEVREDPGKLLRIFRVAHESGLDIHPDALRIIGRNLSLIDKDLRRSPEANADFMAILTSMHQPELNLRRLNEAGVFGRFVPDFGRVVAQMQYDMYHHFTVDEHTIHAIGLLAAIERGELADDHPLSTDLIHKISSRRALYVAVLLHDIAKGRDEDHSIAGERVAQRLCPRLGLSPGETELVAWLVRWHLLMSHFAFKRDIADRQTVLDFCAQVKSPERLRLLLILTVVDIRAVGPGVWNGWKGQLLRDLYEASQEVLVVGHANEARTERVASRRQEVAALLTDREGDCTADLDQFDDAYWLSEDAETIAENIRLIGRMAKNGRRVGVSAKVKDFEDTTRIAVITKERRGIFRRLAKAFATAGANVVDAKIHTSRTGLAVDNFVIQTDDASAFAAEDRLARLEDLISRALNGRLARHEADSARRTVSRRASVFKVEPLVLIDNTASSRATVVEVNARDRVGLLMDLTEALYAAKLSVISAHVATYGERAVDVFYLQTMQGEKIISPIRLKNMEERLLAAASMHRPAVVESVVRKPRLDASLAPTRHAASR